MSKANDEWEAGLWRFHLCKLLGVPHPDYLDAILTYRQQRDWARYNQTHPLDEQSKDDIRTGLLVQSALGPHSKRPIKLKDCMPKWDGYSSEDDKRARLAVTAKVFANMK